MKISADRQGELLSLASGCNPGQVYGPKDMFCLRNSNDSSVEASGFENKMEAKFVRDFLNGVRREIAKNTKKHVPHLVVSRGTHHRRGPSGRIVKQ